MVQLKGLEAALVYVENAHVAGKWVVSFLEFCKHLCVMVQDKFMCTYRASVTVLEHTNSLPLSLVSLTGTWDL